MQTALALLTGVTVCLYLPVTPAPILWLLAALLARFALPGICARATVVALLGAAIASGPALKWQSHLLPVECERTRVQGSGWVLGLPRPATNEHSLAHRFTLQVQHLSPEHCAGPERLRLYAVGQGPHTNKPAPHTNKPAPHTNKPAPHTNKPTALSPGDYIRFSARLRAPHGAVNPFAGDGEKRFLLQGIHAIGSVTGSAPYQLEARLHSPAAVTDRVRADTSAWIRGAVADTAHPDVGSLLSALAVGDQRFIASASWDRLRLFGLTHLLVISGLHITLFALPGWWLGITLSRFASLLPWHMGGTPVLPAVGACSLALIYSALAGFSLPVQRALLMLVLGAIPVMVGRSFDASRHLALCAIALMIIDPLSVLGSSFWLSLGAVATLFVVAQWSGRPGWLRQLALTQGFMLLWSVPLGLFWFQSAGGVGGVLNLVAIPLVSFLVVPPLLLSVLLHLAGGVWAEPLLCFAAVVLGGLWDAMAYWEPALRQFGQFRGAPGPVHLLLALLACLLLLLPAFIGRRRLALLLLVPMVMPMHRSNFAAPQTPLKIVFVDVGQGTAVLLQQGGGTLVYDTGGGPPEGIPVAQWTLLPQLIGSGVEQIDWLIVSHPDRDHDAGVPALERAWSIRQRRDGRDGRDGQYEASPGSSKLADTGAQTCRQGAQLRFGSAVDVTVVSSAQPRDSDNNASCVLLITAYGRRILLPGDIDSRRERELLAYWGKRLQADILLAAHHGSASSSSTLWLRSVSPQMVVVTAAKANRFGHPAPAVVRRIASQGAVLLNTADYGALALEIAPDGGISCVASRHRWRAFWRRGTGRKDCEPLQ